MPKTAWHSSKSLTYLNAIRQFHPCTVVGRERPGTTVSTVVLDLWGEQYLGSRPHFVPVYIRMMYGILDLCTSVYAALC